MEKAQEESTKYVHVPLGYDTKTLIDRLRGHYRTPIKDGLGPAGGEEPDNPLEHVRTFQTPPIQHEAATRLATYEAALREIAEYDSANVTASAAIVGMQAIARKALEDNK